MESSNAQLAFAPDLYEQLHFAPQSNVSLCLGCIHIRAPVRLPGAGQNEIPTAASKYRNHMAWSIENKVDLIHI
jgi:hypothetical protein